MTTTVTDRSAPPWSRDLLQSWDAQQTGFLPRREARFGVIAEVVREVCGATPAVLDLGCGPGSLAQRVIAAVPGATCVAVDADPVLLAIGRLALAGLGDRLRFVDADLRRHDWADALPDVTFDAVVSTTALHWLDAGSLYALYALIHERLAPGGVLLNGDNLAYARTEPVLSRLATERFAADSAQAFDENGVIGWDAWWQTAVENPELAAEAAIRQTRQREAEAAFGSRPAGRCSYALHETALREAGFAEVGTVWQHLDDRVICAVKSR